MHKIVVDKIDNVGFKLVSDFLLSKEQYILDNYPFVSDFGTLSTNNVTTRSSTYNVFHFIDQCTELQKIKDNIKTRYDKYIHQFGLEKISVKPAVNCWFNVLRDSEKIGFHRHSDHEFSFVSCTVTLKCDNTKTIYKYGDDIILEADNVEGMIALFPSNVEHGTSTHYGNECRVTLGVDIFFDIEHSAQIPQFNNNLVLL